MRLRKNDAYSLHNATPLATLNSSHRRAAVSTWQDHRPHVDTKDCIHSRVKLETISGCSVSVCRFQWKLDMAACSLLAVPTTVAAAHWHFLSQCRYHSQKYKNIQKLSGGKCVGLKSCSWQLLVFAARIHINSHVKGRPPRHLARLLP